MLLSILFEIFQTYNSVVFNIFSQIVLPSVVVESNLELMITHQKIKYFVILLIGVFVLHWLFFFWFFDNGFNLSVQSLLPIVHCLIQFFNLIFFYLLSSLCL